MSDQTLADRIDRLRALGVSVYHERYWRGEPRVDRSDHEIPNRVESVRFPFTSAQWCLMCMRENPWEEGHGSLYLGGCCGNMGVVQDTMNMVFRDGGICSIDDLTTMGDYLRGHDGFEQFAGEFDVDAALDRYWQTLDPWEQVCVIHAALEPVLRLPKRDTPTVEQPRPGDEYAESEMRALERALSRMQWSDLFGYGGGDEHDTSTEAGRYLQDRDDARLVNRRMAVARLLGPVRNLLAALEEIEGESFEGYALVEPGTDVVLTGAEGLCVFPSREAAQRRVDLWTRANRRAAEAKARHEADRRDRGWDGTVTEEEIDDEYEMPDAEIVRMRFSMPTGLEIVR